MSRQAISVRRFQPSDDIVALTQLIHRAYAPLAETGLQYRATDQGPEVTAWRIQHGHCCFVAECGGKLAGTINVRAPNIDSPIQTYRNPWTFTFAQYAVDPDFKGLGIGKLLHDAALEHILAHGGSAVALDTAVPAAHLIQMYQRWGYQEVGRHRYDDANYESIVMRRTLKEGVLRHRQFLLGVNYFLRLAKRQAPVKFLRRVIKGKLGPLRS